MDLGAQEHFIEVVEAALADYDQAEANLTEAAQADDDLALRKAGLQALRTGGAAALFLHHFADIVAKRPPAGLPDFHGQVREVRQWLAAQGADDLELLGDVADALKHAVLTQRLPREVEEAGQVLATARGYGKGRYGEGKFGGVDEVWVLARSGSRSLRAVLRSVRDVWQRVLFA